MSAHMNCDSVVHCNYWPCFQKSLNFLFISRSTRNFPFSQAGLCSACLTYNVVELLAQWNCLIQIKKNLVNKKHFWLSFPHTGQGLDCLGFLGSYDHKIIVSKEKWLLKINIAFSQIVNAVISYSQDIWSSSLQADNYLHE